MSHSTSQLPPNLTFGLLYTKCRLPLFAGRRRVHQREFALCRAWKLEVPRFPRCLQQRRGTRTTVRHGAKSSKITPITKALTPRNLTSKKRPHLTAQRAQNANGARLTRRRPCPNFVSSAGLQQDDCIGLAQPERVAICTTDASSRRLTLNGVWVVLETP